MPIWVTTSAVVLSVAMLASLFRKVSRARASVELRRRLDVPPRLWSAVGGLEACAALGLVTGLLRPAVGLAAACGVVLLMTGAIGAHLRVGITGRPLLPPAGLLTVAVLATAGFATAP